MKKINKRFERLADIGEQVPVNPVFIFCSGSDAACPGRRRQAEDGRQSFEDQSRVVKMIADRLKTARTRQRDEQWTAWSDWRLYYMNASVEY